MRYLIGLLVAFFSLTAGIIVLLQSVRLVSHSGLTMTAGAIMIASGLLMLFSVLLVWAVFRARRRQLSLK
jgi:divalent metal cation (Fe/Co/Zn/Cd) transporter